MRVALSLFGMCVCEFESIKSVRRKRETVVVFVAVVSPVDSLV